MAYESFKIFKTKLLTFFSYEIIHYNYRINQCIVDIYFPEYNIVVQICDVDEYILRVKEFEKDAKCMLINVNHNKQHFDSFTERIDIKIFLIDVIKNKLSDNEKLIARLNNRI